MEQTRVVLYDGYCRLCSRTVRWIRRNDRRGRFSFRPLREGPSPEKEAGAYQDADTVVLLERGRRHERSTAAIRIAMGLRFPWPLLAVLLLVPRVIRDAVYDLVARNRLRWFGANDTCYLPGD